jgi:hypothetical protein
MRSFNAGGPRARAPLQLGGNLEKRGRQGSREGGGVGKEALPARGPEQPGPTR